MAALVDADLLLIASDIDVLYTADPRVDSSAMPITEVTELTPIILAMAGGSVGTVGMRTKLEAATKAAVGIATALFCGSNAATVQAKADCTAR